MRDGLREAWAGAQTGASGGLDWPGCRGPSEKGLDILGGGGGGVKQQDLLMD